MSFPLIFQTHDTTNGHFFRTSGRALFTHNNQGEYCEMPDHKAIMNDTKGEALSIVKMNFHIVPHQSAFHIGCKVFESLFGKTPMIGTQKSSHSGITYTVELISEDVRVKINRDGFKLEGVTHWQEFVPKGKNGENQLMWNDLGIMWPIQATPNTNYRRNTPNDATWELTRSLVPHQFEDYYHPFVRVHNHLREQASFTIEMGYYRSRCSNGVMFGTRNAMTYRANYHSIVTVATLERDAIQYFMNKKSSMFNVIGDLYKTLSIPVAKADMHLITLSIFKERFLAMDKASRKIEYDVLLQIASHYAEEIGCNMNAAMNVATEYAQRLYANVRMISGIQKMPSALLRKIGTGGIRTESLLRRLRSEEQYILNHEGIHSIESWEEA